MSLSLINLNLPGRSQADLEDKLALTTSSKRMSVRRLTNLFYRIAVGNEPATIEIKTGAAKATGTLTFTDQPVADEAFTIGNVTFTAKDSGATGDEWNITAGGTPAADAAGNAASVAALINAHASLSKFLTATSALGVVTVTCDVPGDIGNALQFADVDLTNATVSDFATEDTGDDGTETVMVAGA